VSFQRLHLSESVVASARCLPAIEAELEAMNLYPDPNCEVLVSALARHWSVEPWNLAVSNGSDELILLCALSLGDMSLPGAVTAGTFSGHRFALEISRRGYREVPLLGGQVDADSFIQAIPGSGIAFLCNPHNPSGSILGLEELEEIVAVADRTGVPLVVDEAYMEFAPEGTASVTPSISSSGRAIALRTFSKAYGLAGVRIGYAVGCRSDIAAIRSAQRVLPYRVNRLGQVAALAALEDDVCIERVRTETARTRAWFIRTLRAEGFQVRDSATNFVAVAVADAAEVAHVLLEECGIAVRDTGDMGYPGYVRISLGTKRELELALEALQLLKARPTAGQ
jgi:histidinol-phosphate aminotransferase